MNRKQRLMAASAYRQFAHSITTYMWPPRLRKTLKKHQVAANHNQV